MCGIIGYAGERDVVPLLIEGLRKLEYRGYDSAGIAVVTKKGLEIRRAEGKLGNLTAILDYNGIQQTGASADVMPTEPIADKWEAFGWHVQEIDGHNMGEVLNALDRADEVHARPSIIIARTTKGKGVSFMEYDNRWHGMPPNQQQFDAALAELEEGMQLWLN